MDVKKIIKGLRCCTGTSCYGCPYAFVPDGVDCTNQVLKDAIEALQKLEDERSGS